MLAVVAADPRVRQGLAEAQGHVDRIDRTLQDLRRISRPRPFEVAETTVGELVETALRLARHSPAAKHLKVAITLAPSLPPLRVSGDHLVQVFVNLVLNAAESGGDLAIAATGDGAVVRIAFRDTGCGMSPEQLGRLFEPFASTKDGAGHLGLGLYVSREIVHRHGGRITVDSRPGAGSTVTVTLPGAGR
jgi:signal transduction histidine kinase